MSATEQTIQCGRCQTPGVQHHNAKACVRDLLGQLAAAQEDSARLEWIDEHGVYIALRNGQTIGTSTGAIDNARGHHA